MPLQGAKDTVWQVEKGKGKGRVTWVYSLECTFHWFDLLAEILFGDLFMVGQLDGIGSESIQYVVNSKLFLWWGWARSSPPVSSGMQKPKIPNKRKEVANEDSGLVSITPWILPQKKNISLCTKPFNDGELQIKRHIRCLENIEQHDSINHSTSPTILQLQPTNTVGDANKKNVWFPLVAN